MGSSRPPTFLRLLPLLASYTLPVPPGKPRGQGFGDM